MKHSQTLPPTDPNAKPVARDNKTKHTRPVMETYSLEELTFEKFLFSEMSKFSAEIKRTEKKVFATKEYLVAITISHIPPFIVPKTLAEFKAFYKALKLRFANIQWPEFPGAFHIFNRKIQKKQILNKILQNICEVARLRDKDKKALLGIFYAFFLDPQIVNKVRKQSVIIQQQQQPTAIDPKKSTASTTSTIATENDAEADNPDIVNAFQKDIEDRYQNIIYKGSPEENSPDFRDNDSFLGISNEGLGVNPRLLSHSASVSGGFILSEAHHEIPLEQNKSNNRSFIESAPSPYLGGASPSFVSHADQEGDTSKLHALDRSDEVHDADHLDLSADNDTTRSRSIFKRGGKEDPANLPTVPNSRMTSFLDTIGGHDSIDMNEKGTVADKLDAKERKKEEKKKKKEKEKVERKKHIEEAAMSRRRARVGSGVKEIPNFSGIIYMRLSSEKKWSKYFARISNSCLVLYRSILESSPVHFIPCFRCELRYIHNRAGDYMEFWHANDEDRFQITLNTDEEDEVEDHDTSDLSKDLSMWYEQIRIVSEKITGLQLTGNKYSPIGKLQVVIYGAFDVKGLPNNSSCYIRLSHTPYVLATSKTLRNDIMKWKQSFFVPLCDTFFPISIELVCVYNDGWITENLKEEVICTSEILIADVISLKSTNILTINLPMKYTDSKLKALTKQLNVLEKDVPQPKIEVRLKNLSSLKSYFAPPYDDYIEGVKFDSDTFSKQLMKLSISRLKRIITYIRIKTTELGYIFNFKYPLFSYICLILFTFFIIRFDVSSLVQDLILFIVMICIYKNPKVEKTVLHTLDKLFFQPQHLNPFYTQPRIQTVADMDIKKLMNTEKWKYKLVDPDSLVTVFKKAKKSIIAVTIVLTKITGFVEKVKNIITWKDSTRTTVFIIFSLLAYCFISVMSFRMIILFGIWANFAKGIKHYEFLNKRNQETARLALQFVIKEHYPDLYNVLFTDLNLPWPTANFNVFQAKVIDRMKARLSINLPEDALRIARTPVDFILMLATTSAPLKLKMSPAEENSLLMLKKKTPKFGLKNIFYFIMNVPSDYYRVVHPKIVDITECKQD